MKTLKKYKQFLVWAIVMVSLLVGAYFVSFAIVKFICIFYAGFCFNECISWFTNPIKTIISGYVPSNDTPKKNQRFRRIMTKKPNHKHRLGFLMPFLGYN